MEMVLWILLWMGRWVGIPICGKMVRHRFCTRAAVDCVDKSKSG